MKSRIGILLLLTATSFVLMGDSCVLENKDVDVPMRGNVDMEFVSVGFVDADAETVDFGDELEDLEADIGSDIESLISGGIEGGFWRLIENRGDPSTTITGAINVTRTATATTVALILPTQVNLANVGTEFEVAPLEEEGIKILTDGFDEYIDWRNNGGTRPNLEYVFDWSSTASPEGDFTWEARLRFVLTGVFKVEVPDLWK